MATFERRTMKLEHLLNFNDELVGLIRAGLPLDLGLRQMAESSLGGISKLSQRLSDRIASGVSLEQALIQEGDHLPPIYVATVEAGIRSGRLATALEMLSELGRSITELHRSAMVALIYPAIVIGIAYCCLLSFLAVWVPEVLGRFYETFRLPAGPVFDVLMIASNNLATWSWLIPLSMWVLYRTIRKVVAPATDFGRSALLASSLQRFAWVPWMRGAIENLDRATFAKMLGMLVRHETPLSEAVLLSSYATGNAKLITAAQHIAERVKAGDSLATALHDAPQIPPFMCSMLAMGERHRALDGSLWQTSDFYQRRAEKQIEFTRAVLPVVLSCGFGGVATLLYAVCVFAPVLELYAILASTASER